MIREDKIIQNSCIIDKLNKNYNAELDIFFPSFDGDGRFYRNRKGQMSESEIMTIMICYHFGTYQTFKDYYMHYIKGYLKRDFPQPYHTIAS